MEIVERRILSIDGGGFKGVYPTAFLAFIEDQIGRSVADYFDLIVGSSTGGIVALSLGLGMSAREILEMYEELGPKLFDHHSVLGTFKRITGTEYNPKPLEDILRTRFGDKTLKDSKNRLVITSLDLQTAEPVRFRTPHHPDYACDSKIKAVDVALATTAAPTYLPPHISETGSHLVDGGLWAANPVELGVVEAIGILNWPREHIRALSLGCTDELREPGKLEDPSHQGMKDWFPRIFGLRTKADSAGALQNASILLRPENVIRIDQVVSQDRFEIDRASDLPELRTLGLDIARENFPHLRRVFFEHPAERYEPLYICQNSPEEVIPSP